MGAMTKAPTSVYQLSPEEVADIEDAIDEMERGEVASDAEVAAVFKRYGNEGYH